MPYSLKMFDSKPGVIAVHSSGYASIVSHSHEFVEMVYIERGNGLSLVGQEYVKIGKGDFFIIADRAVNHSIQPLEGQEDLSMINIIFPFEYYDIDYSLFNPLRTIQISRIPGGEETIRRICDDYEQKRAYYEKVTYSLAMYLLFEVLREQGNGTTRRSGRAEQNVQLNGYIEKAVNYIHSNYDREITVDAVAKECGLCKAYLQRIFKKERNTTIKEYIIKYRIEQSCKLLLRTDYPVSVIAEMVGFFSLKYFYLKFKEIVGVSPKAYKQQEGSI